MVSFQGIHFSVPSSDLFQLPPSPEPPTLQPPAPGSTLSAPPFSVPASFYTKSLDVRVPITIASVYAVTVFLTNAYNRSRGNQAWPISKTKPFFWFVVAHNIFLAVYSAWTFVGMLGALRRTVQNPTGPAGLAGTVDSLCKMHGTTGLGNAIAYDGSSWVSQSPNVLVSSAGTPDSTDLGRLWNEGLAFYGWIFYLSKFYEVLDTVIILAKGKRSSTLQTYHHAGAMMCMWGGIRYMSPPIWMFCFVNSFIHALMYTYYTLTAFSIYIPQPLKQSLTTMQIIQFLVGASYAALHSFISYEIPVQVPTLHAAASTVSSVVSTAVNAAFTPAGIVDLVKKFLFKAAGEEGLAENIHVAGAAPTQAYHKPSHSGNAGEQFHTEYQTVPCVDTNGQTVAIWMNVVYLTPLTFLFMRFFVKSYLRRGSKGKVASEKKRLELEGKAGEKEDALKKSAEKHVNGNGKAANGNAKAANGNAKSLNGKANGNGKAANGNAKTPNGKAKVIAKGDAPSYAEVVVEGET